MLDQAEEVFQKNLSSIAEIKGKDAETKLVQETENLIDLVKVDVEEKIKDLNLLIGKLYKNRNTPKVFT